MGRKKKNNKDQLDLFEGFSAEALQESIEKLDEEMEKALNEGEFEKARNLAEQQEKLLSSLMVFKGEEHSEGKR